MITIDLVNIVSWFVFGLIVGLVTHLIDPGEVQGGILGTALTGIVGALVGGFLAWNLFGIAVTGFNLPSFIVSVIGALILAFLERMLFRVEAGTNTQFGYKGGRRRL